MESVDHTDTFITTAPDSGATAGTVPPGETVAALTYRMIADRPYELRSSDVIFGVWADRQGLAGEERSAAREEFYARPRACLRSSELGRKWGWGVHADDQGRLMVHPVGSAVAPSRSGRRCARWSVGVTLGGQVPPAGVDESALPWCLHGAGMVVPADMGDRFTGRHPVEDGQAGQGGSCASDATRAGDLHAFARGARPCFAQCVGGGCAVGGEPEIRPAHPPVLPRHRRWSATRQVHPQAGRGVRRDRAAKRPPAHEPARGKAQDTGRRRLPCGAHGPSVATTCSRGGSNGRRCSIGHGGP